MMANNNNGYGKVIITDAIVNDAKMIRTSESNGKIKIDNHVAAYGHSRN